MDDEIPTKRVTRSRTTAKTITAEPEVKITTAAAKARATRNKVGTMTKRKTRADENTEENNNDDNPVEDEVMKTTVKPKVTKGQKKAMHAVSDMDAEPEVNDEDEPPLKVLAPAKVTRGRPRKVVEGPPLVDPPKQTRGRLKKVAAASEKIERPTLEILKKTTRGHPAAASEVDAVEEPIIEEVPVPVKKLTRGRPTAAAKDTVAGGPVEEAVPEPVKNVTRGRAAVTAKAATVPKKTVKFDEIPEQDKENIIPVATTRGKGKDVKTGTGIRARPVRKPAVSTRVVRSQTRTVTGAEKLPLTPKKATQVAIAKDSLSEDELATMEKTPLKPLTKSPFKAPGSVLSSNRKLDFTSSIIANRVVTKDFGAFLMGSPARKPPPPPFKDSMKTSPKRVNMGDSMTRSPYMTSVLTQNNTSPFKSSLLQSPAKRPQSPKKVTVFGSTSRDKSTFGVTPKGAAFTISRFDATPCNLTRPVTRPGRSLLFRPSKDTMGDVTPNDSASSVATVEPFPGRLSSILPRDADPVMQDSAEIVEECHVEVPNDAVIVEEAGHSEHQILEGPMGIDDDQTVIEIVPVELSTTPTNSPPRYSIGNFDFRDEQDQFEDSGSEDELASGSPKYSPAPLRTVNISSKDFAAPATPNPVVAIHQTPKTAVIHRTPARLFHQATRSQSVRARKENAAFTPLAQQLSDWMSAATSSDPSYSSILSKEETMDSVEILQPQAINVDTQLIAQSSPVKSSFFEDAMSVCDAVAEQETVSTGPEAANNGLDAMDFAPATLDEEDLALAAEADEMSLISVHIKDDFEGAVDTCNQSVNGAVREASEASQEYGDENRAPADQNQTLIDPTLLALDVKQQFNSLVAEAPILFTPVRVLGERERVYHTVSKVPLKPAAEDSPLKITKRSTSASRMPAQRYAPLPPSFVVPQLPIFGSPALSSPAKPSNWSTAVTPLQTPRRDINDQVLKGAVIYVDVHTTEGANASAVFVELLEQMGARCVKNWNWNPNSSISSENDEAGHDANKETAAANSKIGITHVVFKDGRKRTLERVRESKGLVLCVGVTWVLDCERQKTWLPEPPYTVDTALVPRGGQRRRKSMEPRSIQNLNGAVSFLPSSSGPPRSVSANHFFSPSKDSLNTPGPELRSARRKSTLWMRSPSFDDDTIDAESHRDVDPMGGLILSPVPLTPAPETISAYSENVLDAMAPGMDGGVTPYFLRKEELVQRTCPPKRDGEELGAFEGYDDQGRVDVNGMGSGVLMHRLLLARRKSLQWAPKVGSPLAKSGYSREA